MRKVLLFLLLLVTISCGPKDPVVKEPIITVSIGPFRYFVEGIAGSDFIVNVMVPPGSNPHIYEPFPEQINKGDEIPEKLHDHDLRMAHIHVIPVGSEHWLRHIAFRDYLRTHPTVLTEYQKLKEELGKKEWKDGNEYNDAKNDFIQDEEQKAIRWYKDNKSRN